MKATDLMIGDWVKDETMDYPSKEKNYIVKGIYSAPDGMFAQIAENDSDSVFHVTCEVLEPIELTEKILEKNFPDTEILGWNPYLVTPVIKSFTIECPYDEVHSVVKIVKYVHEIQHILKMFGIEKEIEL